MKNSDKEASTILRSTPNQTIHPPLPPTIFTRFRLILNTRKEWSAEKIGAVLGWFALGTTTWAIVGTTTFLSGVLLVAKTIDMDEWLIIRICRFVSSQTGMDVSFEEAKGEWGEGLIRLKNVKVVRNLPDEAQCRNIMLTIKELDVKLSMNWWLEGKGFVKEAVVSGVRGTLDGKHLVYDPDWKPCKLQWTRGDFVLNRLHLADVMVTVLNRTPHRPLSLSIFNLEAKTVRRQWLFFDLMLADNVVGSFDDYLFTLRKPQSVGPGEESLLREFKLASANIDLLGESATGVLSWIDTCTMGISARISMTNNDGKPFDPEYYTTVKQSHDLNEDWKHGLIDFKINIQLNNLRASVPMSTADMSLRYQAVVRPIVAYLNTNYTEIPLACSIQMPLKRFDGAWYPGDIALWESLADGLYDELTRLVYEQKKTKNAFLLLHKGATGLGRAAQHCWKFASDYVWVLYIL